MTPARIGRVRTMRAGERSSISRASRPIASTRSSVAECATTVGSLSTIPRPRTYTRMLDVPRSIPTCLANTVLSQPLRALGLSGRAAEGCQVGCRARRRRAAGRSFGPSRHANELLGCLCGVQAPDTGTQAGERAYQILIAAIEMVRVDDHGGTVVRRQRGEDDGSARPNVARVHQRRTAQATCPENRRPLAARIDLDVRSQVAQVGRVLQPVLEHPL